MVERPSRARTASGWRTCLGWPKGLRSDSRRPICRSAFGKVVLWSALWWSSGGLENTSSTSALAGCAAGPTVFYAPGEGTAAIGSSRAWTWPSALFGGSGSWGALRSTRLAIPSCASSPAFLPKISLALLLVASSGQRPAEGQTLGLHDFVRLAQRCAASVAPTTLAAVAGAESGFNPLSMHDNTLAASGSPSTAAEAVGLASSLTAAGHSVDLGLMQINSANLGALGLTLGAAFDPCQSLAAGAVILTADYAGGATHGEQQVALRAAFSRYNTGNPLRGFVNGYVSRVEAAARQVVPAIDPTADMSSTTVAAAAGEVPERAIAASPSSPWLVWVSGRSPATRTAEETNQQAAIFANVGHGASAAAVDYAGTP